MIASEKEYKRSGIEWIPEIPENWEIIRIKNLFKEIDIRSEFGEEDLLSVSQYSGVTLKRDNLENDTDEITNAATLAGYKKVSKGDLIINIMLAWNGSLGISKYDGITSPAYCVYRCLNGNNPEYFGYLFSTNLYKTEFRKNSTGIIESRLRLYSDNFFEMFSFVPPKEEQDKIVNQIKLQSEKINRFIEKKQRFIELLKEQRQSIINHAITKGINPHVKMKDSGIEWLGDVPEHWEVRRLKKVCILQRGYDLPKELFVDGDYPVYGSNGIIGYHNEFTTKAPCITVGRSGSVGEVNYIFQDFWAHNTCLYVKESYNNNWDYLYGLLSSIDIKMLSNGSAVPTLDRKNVHALFVSYPSIEEQKQIVEHFKDETKIIDTTISKTEREIELMKEYKEAMIAEAVVGKYQKIN